MLATCLITYFLVRALSSQETLRGCKLTICPRIYSRCEKIQSHLNNFPILINISLPHWPQKMTGTLQMPFHHGRLPSQHEACYCCSQSGEKSCPARAKTRRSDSRSPVCSHPRCGRNLQCRQISFETPSILPQPSSYHRRL